MELIRYIKQKLQNGLPGQEAQYKMAPMGRLESTFKVPKYSEAAVLCLLYPKPQDLHMLFIKRAQHDKDRHSAQIAFPGGKVEKEDTSFIKTALREANEEVGLSSENIEIISEITPLPIPVSRFKVFPVLAYTPETPQFSRQVSEVDEILEFPLQKLLNPESVRAKSILLSTGQNINNVPVYDIDGHIIWGATAMILSEVIDIIR